MNAFRAHLPQQMCACARPCVEVEIFDKNSLLRPLTVVDLCTGRGVLHWKMTSNSYRDGLTTSEFALARGYVLPRILLERAFGGVQDSSLSPSASHSPALYPHSGEGSRILGHGPTTFQTLVFPPSHVTNRCSCIGMWYYDACHNFNAPSLSPPALQTSRSIANSRHVRGFLRRHVEEVAVSLVE